METEPSVTDSPHSELAERLPSLSCPLWKRTLDIVCIVVSLPFLLPVVVLVSLWVWATSKGPVLFRQERIGRGGCPFTIYKFRSIETKAGTQVHLDHVRGLIKSDRQMTKLDRLGDDRLIPGGGLLCNLGLDELPQLINVLRGEMSLVGPRPCLPEEYELYEEGQKKRFSVQPGLTGYWQVKGKNQTTFTQMIALDDYYVRERSLFLDLSIMWQTPGALLRQFFNSRVEKAVVSPTSGEEGEELS